MARTMWTPLSRGCMRMASLKSWNRISGNCSRMLSSQNPASSGTFHEHKHYRNYSPCLALSGVNAPFKKWFLSHSFVCVVWVMHHLFLQVPSITEKESNGLDQRHQDENSDKDELVVVWQGRILETTVTTTQLNELNLIQCDLELRRSVD